jgi:hypothetical protein
MSKVRVKFERKSELDLGQGKISKNRVKQALRQWTVPEVIFENNDCIYIDNCIQVGMYEICIIPKMKSGCKFFDDPKTKLKDYGGFSIEIFERKNDKLKAIQCHRDGRFKEQKWVSIVYTYNVRIKDLLEMILHCSRLNNLRVFS